MAAAAETNGSQASLPSVEALQRRAIVCDRNWPNVRFSLNSDRLRTLQKRRDVPLTDSRAATKRCLFDHLVGAAEQCERESDAERFGSVSLFLQCQPQT